MMIWSPKRSTSSWLALVGAPKTRTSLILDASASGKYHGALREEQVGGGDMGGWGDVEGD